MDAAERALLATTVRDALAAGRAAPDAVLADLGWLEMLAAERSDAADAVAVVFGALGRTGASATALDDVVANALGVEPRADLAVVLPPFAAWDPPGAVGLATARVVRATELLVVTGTGRRFVAPAAAARTAIGGLDPDLGLHHVRLDERGAPRDPVPLTPGAWDAAVAAARVALAHQMAGAGRAMLELARTHALERVQFDRPIARFQAVRHRLADALVALEGLDAALGAARDETGQLTAALAKAAAGRAARTVGTHAQQVLAGVGFTTEHPFHRFLKRTMVLDGLFGTADDLVVDIGRRLLATRAVPTLIEL